MADARDLWLWRNDPTTRQMSMNTDEIPWDGHERWLASSLERTDRLLLIGAIDGQRIGVSRLDMMDEDTAEVSITLRPSARGRGLSREFLLKAIDSGRSIMYFTKAKAEVKASNVPSNRLFLSAGFELSETRNNVNVYFLSS